MYGEAKKLHLIEEILKIENEQVLDEVETLLSKNNTKSTAGRRSFKDFAGMMSDEEANALEKIIEEECEQIHPDDWK